jgi:protein-serine/threonine kinase
LAIIKKLKHKNIVDVIDVFKFKRLVYVFMDLAKNGSIKEFVDKHKHPVRESQAKVWLNDIMAGISYVHSKGVAHRDLKLENILLDVDYSALISDFGFAVMDITSNKLMRTTYCGSPDYMAPEVIETKLYQKPRPYDAKKADLYSIRRYNKKRV